MYDPSKRKSSGYCRGRNTLRTVTTTKWELPIPGSKSYWDKICDDIEKRKEHVSHSPYPPSSSSELINNFHSIFNYDESKLNKSDHIAEPIVKISPPTPMRMAPQSADEMTLDENYSGRENYRDNYLIDQNLRDGITRPVNNVIEKKDSKLYEISICMTEFLKNNNNTVQTKKSCLIHKNNPPLKIFDDNLKKFLSKKKMTKKLSDNKIQRKLSSDVMLDFSKLHRSKSCPLRSQSVSKERVGIGIRLIGNEKKILRSLRRSQTEGPREKKLKSDFGQFLKVPESPYVNVRSSLKNRILDRKSKSKILISNLNHMLSIPKLNDFKLDENFILNEKAVANKNFRKEFQSLSDPQVSFSVEHFEPTLNGERKRNEKNDDEDKIGNIKLQNQVEKDFLKVPKLGTISSYPSFSKLIPGESVEAEDSQDPVIHISSEMSISDNSEYLAQKTESRSCKRDFLKVPKLSMMSSYPSFTSLIPESIDSDDNATGSPELISEITDHETKDTSILTDKPTVICSNNEIPADHDKRSDLKTSRSNKFIPSTSPSTIEKPKRRQSLKDSVRFAYRALKFITPNKNLDFKPQSYQPTQESCSTTGSSDSSRDSKYSKFEPAIKLLTYEDVDRDQPPIRSASSSTYGTVKSRLRQSASQYLGSDYVFSSSRAMLDSPSTTIPSLTRSTSGPTPEFQEPVLSKPSDKALNKLPKMSIFPRKKYDKCFACLHKTFEEPVKFKRGLPLTTLNAIAKEIIPTFSESESSSISLPDVKDFVESQSDYENNWNDVLQSTKRSSLLEKAELKSLKGFSRANVDSYKSRQTLARASEENQSLKSDARIENMRKNLSPKDSIVTNNHSKPLSLSSEHSKPSSISGHSSESEEPQVQVKQSVQTSECFASPYAPTHWAPPLEPLKSLKLRKPVSMHGRAVSITKTEDDSTSDDNANNYRSTRKETKLINTSARQVDDQNQDSTILDSSVKPVTKFGEKPDLIKQPSLLGKILTSQLSIVANLAKTPSKVDLLSNIPKSESQTTSATDGGEENSKKASKKSEKLEASLHDDEPTVLDDLKTDLHSVDTSSEKYLDGKSFEKLLSKSQLPVIAEKLIENENLVNKSENETDLESFSGIDTSGQFEEHELHIEESRDTYDQRCEIYSSKKVIEILEKCVDENQTPFEMLQALSAAATQTDPFTSKEIMSIPEVSRTAKIAKNLLKLLIDSKKYLHPDTFSPNLQFSSPQIPLCNPRQLRRVLPNKTYNLVARILGMPEYTGDKVNDQKSDFKSKHQTEDPFKLRHPRNRGPTADSWDMIVHPPSARGGRKSEIDEDGFEYPKQSPYALFMNKPRRKAIKWRPLTERDMLGYDPEATLNMRATRVTNEICKDFCEWLRGLGGGQSEDIDEEVLKDMFQIEFTAEACRAMQVLITEIPMVPIAVALARNTPGAGELALTRKHLIRDAKAESMPNKIIGFGSMLPQARRFVPPQNRVNEKWLQCENVPKDLETMETVWKGITHLDSVKGFLAWVKAHPGVKPPKILTETYTKKEALFKQPSAEEASGHIELEMDQIESLKVGDVE